VPAVKFRARLKRAARTRIRRKVTLPAKRAVRKQIRRRPLFHCGSCGKQYNNMFGHTCGSKGDFGKRRKAAKRAAAAAVRKTRRAAERQKQNERVARVRQRERGRAAGRVSVTRRRERAKADERVARARNKPRRAPRPRPSSHDYRNCRDHDCERQACEAYREGLIDAEEAER